MVTFVGFIRYFLFARWAIYQHRVTFLYLIIILSA
jgi:hypothetical protein